MKSENSTKLLEQRTASFLAASEEALPLIQQQTDVVLSDHDITCALVDRMDLEESDELLDRDWTQAAVIEALAGYNFRRLRPELVEQVELAHSIVPDDVIRLITEEKIKFKGEIWIIHKNDADPFPSDPHAHNSGKGLKLHLGTGELFSRKENAGRVSQKNLQELRNRIRYRPLPPLELK